MRINHRDWYACFCLWGDYTVKKRRGTARLSSDENKRCVYFIQDGENGLIKIGMTTSGFYKRFNTLQQMNGGPLYVLGVIRDENPKTLEFSLHKLFASERVHGEWFIPSDRVLEHIRLHAHQVEQPVVVGQIACPNTCEKCLVRIATTRDNRLCKRCLRQWAASQSPVDSRPAHVKRKNDYWIDFEQDPSFENAVRRIEDSTHPE